MNSPNRRNRLNNKNHYICSVRDKLSPQFEIYGAYFDGTQAQAIKYFKAHRRIKKYVDNVCYNVSFRGNPITFGWDC